MEFLLNDLQLAFDLCSARTRVLSQLTPGIDHALLHQPHVAERRLELCQLVDEQSFELAPAHVHGTALPLAMVVGVMVVAPFRPAFRQWLTARFTPHKAAQREVRMVPPGRTGHLPGALRAKLPTASRECG